MDIAVLGIDLGKNSCSIVGLDSSGKVVLRRRMQRKTIVTTAAKLSLRVSRDREQGFHRIVSTDFAGS